MDWNSRLNKIRGKLLRDYAEENSCIIPETDSPTTKPHKPSVTPDALDMVMIKNLSIPVYLTSCSALSSVHHPVLIDTACRSSFHNPPYRPDFRRTDSAKFQTQLQEIIPFDPELHEMANDTSVENFSGAVLKALAASTPKRRPRDDPQSPISPGIQDEIRLKIRSRRQW